MTDQPHDDGSPTSGGPSSAVPGGSDPVPAAEPPPVPPPPWQPPWQPPPPYPGSPPSPYGAPGGWASQPPQYPPYGAPPGTWGQPPYGWGSGYYPQPPATNGFAIASLVLSLTPFLVIGLGWGSLLGLIFGIVALRQTARDGTRGRGLALAGVIIGAIGLLVVIAIAVGVAVTNGSSSDTGTVTLHRQAVAAALLSSGGPAVTAARSSA